MPVQNNGAQNQLEISGNQIVFDTYNFYGINPAMPPNNDRPLAMPAAQGANQSQQVAAQGFPHFADHENIHGNPQPFQRDQVDELRDMARAQVDFFARLQLSANAQNLLRAINNNPFAMDGLIHICLAAANDPRARAQVHAHQQQQRAQSPQLALERPQNQRILQSVESATPGEASRICENPDTPSAISDGTQSQIAQDDDQPQHIDAPASHHASSASDFGTPNAHQGIQARVKVLIKQPATDYKGYIKNDNEYALYEEAVWRAKRKESGIQNKCQGFPDDFDGKVVIAERIFNAIQNIDGEQDPASDSGEFKDSVAVRTVKGLSALEAEMIAHKLIEDMRKIQCGECILDLPAEYKIVQEDSFTEKLDQVVEALNVSTSSGLTDYDTLTTE